MRSDAPGPILIEQTLLNRPLMEDMKFEGVKGSPVVTYTREEISRPAVPCQLPQLSSPRPPARISSIIIPPGAWGEYQRLFHDKDSHLRGTLTFNLITGTFEKINIDSGLGFHSK